MTYYHFCPKVKPGTATAYKIGGNSIGHELIPELRGLNEIPFGFKLKNAGYKGKQWVESDDLSGLKHLWTDFIPNDLAWPLMSEKMKELISPELTQKEGIVWMLALINSDTETRRYYLPRFEHPLDVLDKESTVFGDNMQDMVISAVFSLEKVANYGLFPVPQIFYEVPVGLYVNEEIKNILVKEKVTGLGFEKATTT